MLARSVKADGFPLVSDQALIEARQGRRTLTLLSLPPEARHTSTVEAHGFAILGSGELDLVIDPEWRGQGLASCALRRLLREHPDASSEIRTWVHGNQPAAEKLLAGHGFRPVRTLLRFERGAEGNPRNPSTPSFAPAGFTFTSFRQSDAADWVALNARVFADHPEQGAITIRDLEARLAEPWFNAEDFILLRNNDELIGYCWLKVDGDEGEIYVIGVSPDFAGQGLGSALLDEGIRLLVLRGVTRISLYVEADNQHAVRLYEIGRAHV